MNFMTVAAFELARPGGRLVDNSVRYLIGPSSNLARELRRSSAALLEMRSYNQKFTDSRKCGVRTALFWARWTFS